MKDAVENLSIAKGHSSHSLEKLFQLKINVQIIFNLFPSSIYSTFLMNYN